VDAVPDAPDLAQRLDVDMEQVPRARPLVALDRLEGREVGQARQP
jgi:hypothetical protein